MESQSQSTFLITRNRVCAFSFKNEKDLPDGQKLLTCARCLETCYIDREAQLKHYKIHKQTCCKREHETFDPRVVQETAMIDAVNQVGFSLQNPSAIKGRFFLRAFQRILYILKERDLTEEEIRNIQALLGTFMEEMKMNGVKNGNNELAATALLEKVWGIPGFANFFLSEDLFLSDAMREWKQKGVSPPPRQEYVDGVLDQSTAYDPSLQLRLPFCTVLSTFLVCSAICARKMAKTYALSINIARVAAKSWMCGYSRVSHPSVTGDLPVLHHSRSLWLTWILPSSCLDLEFHQDRDHMNDEEVYPGLTLKQVLTVLMEDETYFYTFPDFRELPPQCRDAASSTEILQILFLFLYDPKSSFKERMNASDRIDLLEIFHSWNPPKNIQVDIADVVGSEKGINVSLLEAMFLLITSLSTSALLEMKEELNDPANSKSKYSEAVYLFQEKLEILLDRVVPGVEYLIHDIFEPLYQQRMEDLGEKALSFPAELITHISEFALPNQNGLIPPTLWYDCYWETDSDEEAVEDSASSS